MTHRPDPADAYRAANAALDERPSDTSRAAILAAAARAVDAKPSAAGRAPSRRWRIPLAAAATVLISTVAVIVAQRTERALPAAASPEGAAAPAAEPQKADAVVTAKPAEPVRPEPPAAPIAKAPPPRDNAAPVARSTPQPERARLRKEEAPVTAADMAKEPAVVGKTTAPAAAGMATAPAAAGVSGEPTAGGVAAAREAPPRPATAPAPAAPQAALERRAAEADAAAPASRTETPEQWLARIIELRRAARDGEADAELKKLRERYPHLVIPAAALRRAGTR